MSLPLLVGSFVGVIAGCRGASGSTGAPELPGPPFDAETVRLAERETTLLHLNVGEAPLSILRNGARTDFRKAIVFGDDGMLKVIASTSTAFNCDAPSPPLGAVSLEATFDPGPLGDYYAGKPTPALVTVALPGDTARTRDLHPSISRIEISPFHDGDETVTLHFDLRSALGHPDPKVPTNILLRGRADATLCPSAVALGPGPLIDPQGPVKVTIGERTFIAGTVLAFLHDDGKNGAAISGLGFYEQAGATCDAAARALADDGGGINGVQVDTGPLAVNRSQSWLGGAHPIIAQISDVTAGGVSFEQRMLTEEPLRGFVHIGAAELKELKEDVSSQDGAVYGTIHAETPQTVPPSGEHASIDGVFGAKICTRAW